MTASVHRDCVRLGAGVQSFFRNPIIFACSLISTLGRYAIRDESLMLKVIAQDFINLDKIDVVAPLYRELVEKTRKEARCVSYELFINQKDPGHFIFIEEWPDRAALDTHCQSEHFIRLVPLIDKHQRQEGTYLLMDSFE